MTLLDDRAPADEADDVPRLGEAAAVDDAAIVALSPAEESAPAAPLVSPLLASTAAFLATAGAGWMVGGVFIGNGARLVGVLAALLGAGMVALSHRTRTPTLLQLVVLPLGVVVGAVLVAPDATGGTANLPNLVREALTSGGLATPPVPFDPGWRFLVVLLLSWVAVIAATAAIGMARPRLAVVVPMPLTAGAVLLQPPGAEIASVSIALVLSVGALAVAYGADLKTQGTTGAQFEARRLGKAAGIMVALVAALVLLAQLGLFLPEEQESKSFPPKRPSPPPATKDRVIFSVKSDRSMPWRVGVLDVYKDNAWMTPPIDTKRLETLLPGGQVPRMAQPPADRSVSAEFELFDLEGHALPAIATPSAVGDAPAGLRYDPRTQQLQTVGRPRSGTRYTVVAPAPPETVDLLRAPPPRKDIEEEFARVPTAPFAVHTLLSELPDDLPAYERLQFVRTRFYEKVVAAGPGSPVDVPPSRVVELLDGGEGSPFEITAAEVLLARWAGVPARIGYGYYGGDVKGDAVQIRPRHGAMWLEAYFEGSGWVAIVGRPPQARSSLNQTDKIEDPQIRPTDELGATVYIPLRKKNVTFLSSLVRYWLGQVLPALALLAFLVAFYVGPLKALRRVRRRRWARGRPRERIAVAYSELRDYAIDLNIGHPTLSPLEFLDVTIPDEDHSQLGWAVTRALWGDLARDCRSEDAARCELWADSLRRRIAAEQSPFGRVVALCSRASLRDPYSDEIPNLWWPWSPRDRLFGLVRRGWALVRSQAKRVRRARLRRAARRSASSTAGWVLLLGAAALLLPGCVRDIRLDIPLAAQALSPLPEVPAELSGYRFEVDDRGVQAFEFYYDTSLAATGQLYAVRDGNGVVQATLQTTVLKPVITGRPGMQQKILESIGSNQFKTANLGGQRVHTLRLPEQRLILAFGPGGDTYQLLVATQAFADAERLFADLLAKQEGRQPGEVRQAPLPRPDPKRGLLP